MKSVIIIGKGPSVLKCKKEWVETFDEVAMINAVPFENYEDKIGSKAKYWFRNWSCTWYPDEYLKQLEISIVVNTTNKMHSWKGKSFSELFPKHITCLFPNYFDEIKCECNFSPTSGTSAFEYFIKHKFDRIGMVGIDLYQIGMNRYFHENEIQEIPNEHDMIKTLEFMNNRMKDNPQIQFEILSDAKFISLPNIKNIIL